MPISSVNRSGLLGGWNYWLADLDSRLVLDDLKLEAQTDYFHAMY